MNNKQGKETCRLELPLGPNQAKEITNRLGLKKVSCNICQQYLLGIMIVIAYIFVF